MLFYFDSRVLTFLLLALICFLLIIQLLHSFSLVKWKNISIARCWWYILRVLMSGLIRVLVLAYKSLWTQYLLMLGEFQWHVLKIRLPFSIDDFCWYLSFIIITSEVFNVWYFAVLIGLAYFCESIDQISAACFFKKYFLFFIFESLYLSRESLWINMIWFIFFKKTLTWNLMLSIFKR